MDLIDELNEIKKSQGVRNIDISKVTGISPSHLSDIFNKRAYPSLNSFIKITRCLNLNISFVSESNEEYNANNEIKELTTKYLIDYSTWTKEDKNDLVEYLKSKRKIIDLKKKDRT